MQGGGEDIGLERKGAEVLEHSERSVALEATLSSEDYRDLARGSIDVICDQLAAAEWNSLS